MMAAVAVYVDPPIWEWRGKNWCHLTADSTSELHAFAAKLGLRRSWFQHKPRAPWQDHYDVTEGMRFKAIKLGAVDLDFTEAGRRQGRRRLLYATLVELCGRYDLTLDRAQLAAELRTAMPELARRAGVTATELREALKAMADHAEHHEMYGLDKDREITALRDVALSQISTTTTRPRAS